MSQNAEWSTNRLLSTAARLVEHSWNERLAALGVTHAGRMALDVLREHGTLSQARLAQEVRVQAQTMGKTLHRLEAHGHISRSPNLQDRRSHLVSITEAGENMLDEAARLEEGLIHDGALADEQLRRSLAHIISTLGASRWKLDVDEQGAVHEVGSAGADDTASIQAAEGPGEAPSSAGDAERGS
ncbi:MarR family winged helix-turn-helix transcriptional regulator [Kocuria palustris]|uniref:MarR family winged helix-turn-helix transcriptional regulator n=1 Tax=Kocuria palustris TaxID=71999 RepID=UPI00119E836B|nr:MarR family transcriptional regulator [Kocuria palustris]